MDTSSENLLSHLSRVLWDEVFMAMACVYAMRSPDNATRHGCIIVDANNVPIGFGYNGFPKGGKNDGIYPRTRPGKYTVIAHSELNSLLNRSLNTQGGTAYITGRPCSQCMIAMIQGGIKKIVYGKIGSHCVDQKDWDTVLLMAKNCNINVVEYTGELPYNVLSSTQEYLKLKGWISEAEKTEYTN